jgi:hypothetical protein
VPILLPSVLEEGDDEAEHQHKGTFPLKEAQDPSHQKRVEEIEAGTGQEGVVHPRLVDESNS